MGRLLLVRHGQASLWDKDYDRLSELGEEQSRRLGDHLAGRGAAFDAVFVGPRRRQRHTADLVAEAYRSRGHAWPEPVALSELDEFDFDGLYRGALPALRAEHPDLDRLAGAVDGARDPKEAERAIQRVIEALTALWVEGRTNGVEPWSEFHARVRHAVARMTDGGARRVCAFTSGGPIGVSVQSALGAPEPVALALAFRVRNGSLTELAFRDGRLALESFNGLPHLPEPSLQTYR